MLTAKGQFIKKLLYPFRWILTGLTITALIWAIDISLRPFIIKIMLDRLQVIQPKDVLNALSLPIFAYIFVSVLTTGFIYRWYDYLHMQLNAPLKRETIEKMMAYVLRHDHRFFQNTFSGGIASRINDVGDSLRECITIVVDRFIGLILIVAVAMITMATVSYQFTMALAVWVLVFTTVIFFATPRVQERAKIASFSGSQLVGRMTDTLSNVSSVRLFVNWLGEKKQLARWTEDYVEKRQQVDRFFFYLGLFQAVSFLVFICACLYLLVKGFEDGTVTVGDFALILGINIQVFDNLWLLSKEYSLFVEHTGKISQALDFVTLPHALVDHTEARELHITQGRIEFQKVFFQFEHDQPLFDNLSLSIKGGERVGLVGFSGSGKTTLVNLLLRLFDIQRGRILIDGQDIARVTQDSLRRNIAIIPQEPLLFHRSLMENIRYGNLEACDDAVIAAAERAHAHDFIQKLPLGYYTEAGERGVKISGGQRQRIAIARAFLKNAPILLLDEATSALDSITERLIQETLENCVEEKTILVVAHRLTTLRSMDRILVFDKGVIVEEGTHEALLTQKGLYKKMWEVGGFLP